MNSSGLIMTKLTRDVLKGWKETREYWRDAKSEEFDQKYMEELAASVDAAATVMDQVDKLITKIRKDCE